MMSIQLYDHQLALNDQCRASMLRGCRSVLMQGATGVGKTIMASAQIEAATKKGKSTWFVVPRRYLLTQIGETYSDFDIPFSYIAAGYSMNPCGRNFICSANTLKARLDTLKAPDLAVLDEVHYGSDGLDRIITWLKANGTWIIGLTATPWKMNGQGLGCWFDDMVLGPSIAWLIENKRLAQFRMFAPSHVDLSRVKITAGDYAKGQLSELMEQNRVLIGNAVKHYADHARGRLGVTFAVSRKHSQMLAAEYQNHGIYAAHVDADTPDDERRRVFRAYARREIHQLCCAELLTFGFDIASASGYKNVTVECITDCQPTKSLSKQMQKWGRGLRYDPVPHLFFDHANNVQEHGMPDADRHWTLEDRLRDAKSAKGEKSVPVMQCESCWYVDKPFDVCPNCGKVREVQYRKIKTVDGELTEITRSEILADADPKKMQEAIDGLTRNGIAKGMPKWAAMKWAAKKVTEDIVRRGMK